MQIEEFRESGIIRLLKKHKISVQSITICEVCERKANILDRKGISFLYDLDGDMLYRADEAWVYPVCSDCLADLLERELLEKLQQFPLTPSFEFRRRRGYYVLHIFGYKRFKFNSLGEIEERIQQLIYHIWYKNRDKIKYESGKVTIDEELLYSKEALEVKVLSIVKNKPFSQIQPIRSVEQAVLAFIFMEDLDVKEALDEFNEKDYILSPDGTLAIVKKDADYKLVKNLEEFKGIDKYDEVIYGNARYRYLKQYRKLYNFYRKHINRLGVDNEPVLVMESKHIYLVKAPYIEE